MDATSAADAVGSAAAAVYVAANAIASAGIAGAYVICVDGAADDVAARSTIVALVSDDATVVVPA